MCARVRVCVCVCGCTRALARVCRWMPAMLPSPHVEKTKALPYHTTHAHRHRHSHTRSESRARAKAPSHGHTHPETSEPSEGPAPAQTRARTHARTCRPPRADTRTADFSWRLMVLSQFLQEFSQARDRACAHAHKRTRAARARARARSSRRRRRLRRVMNGRACSEIWRCVRALHVPCGAARL